MSLDGLSILGMGTAVPAYAMLQVDAGALATHYCSPTEAQAKRLAVLYKRTGIRQRGSVLLENVDGVGVRQNFFQPVVDQDDRGPTTGQRMVRYEQEAKSLALRASQRAVHQSGIDVRQLGQIITVSCTGFSAPGIDVALIKGLGLTPHVGRTHIGFMGCHGALNGLRVASALSRACPETRILLCAVEVCSLHFRYGWSADQIVANALFADGAAALVAGSSAQAPGEGWRVLAMGSCLFPDSEGAMTWRIGDHGFEMRLSPAVPALISKHLRPWLESWLGKHGLTLSQVRSWAIHPGGPRIVSAVGQTLGLSPEDTQISREVLLSYGNMSSPTILFILDRLRTERAPRPCVALGFGPGLAVEAALLH